jgi:anthranilate synthase component 2
MRILLLDNRDSFTWNLAHDLERFGAEVTTMPTQGLAKTGALGAMSRADFDGVVLSPGPGLPDEHPQLRLVIAWCVRGKLPVLGVCLGMQALIEHFGGRLRNLDQPLHGVARVVQKVAPCPMLGVSAEIKVGHYHSWVADEVDWPEVFEVTARGENMIMAMRHKSLPITGVQFHPESVLTPDGRGMLKRWLGSLQH